jgi:hypothetical protein
VRRPDAGVIETEVMHVVHGVVQCASKRQFRLSAPLRATAPAEIHAQA